MMGKKKKKKKLEGAKLQQKAWLRLFFPTLKNNFSPSLLVECQ